MPEERPIASAATGDFRAFLQDEWIRRCRKNPRYSLRAFARSLDYDVSTLSKVLRGQRPLGRRAIADFGAKLGLDPQTLASFQRGPAPATVQAQSYQQLAVDTFAVISDWYHYAILELMPLKKFRPSPSWIAKALGISLAEVNGAVERLQRVGLLEIGADGKWRDLSDGHTTTVGSAENTAAAFRNMQRQLLEKALSALEEIPIARRDQSTMTMAIDRRDVPAVKEAIKRFRRHLVTQLERAPVKNEVYTLNLSFFPLTDLEDKK